MHDPAMHDSCINYSNKIKSCTENHANGKQNFAEQKTVLLLHSNTHFSVTNYVWFAKINSLNKQDGYSKRDVHLWKETFFNFM